MNKKILPLCAVLVLSAGLVACGDSGESGTKVKMEVWIADANVSWAKDRVAAFKEANKKSFNYEVKVTPVGEKAALAQMDKDPEAAADVFHFPGDQLGALVSAGNIKELGSEIKEALVETYGFNEAAINSGLYGNKFYGIPFTPNSYFLYYNSAKVTAEETKSLDALLSKGKVIMPIDDGWYQTAFWYGTGVRFFGPNGTDDGTSNLNSDLGYAAGRAINKYINHPNFVKGDDGFIKANFTKTSDYVAAIDGAWASEDLLKANALGDDLGATILPNFTEGSDTYPMMATGDWKKIGVSKYSLVPDHAAKLAVWLSNAESQLQKCERFNDAPVIADVLEMDVVKNNIVVAALGAQTQTNVVRQPNIPQMSNWWDAATAFANKMYEEIGIWTPEKIETEVNALNVQLLAKKS